MPNQPVYTSVTSRYAAGPPMPEPPHLSPAAVAPLAASGSPTVVYHLLAILGSVVAVFTAFVVIFFLYWCGSTLQQVPDGAYRMLQLSRACRHRAAGNVFGCGRSQINSVVNTTMRTPVQKPSS